MSVELLGFNIDDYSFDDAVREAVGLINSGTSSQIVTINPEMFAYAENDEIFSKIVSEAQMIIPDGVGVKIALKLKGHNVERIPGIDFARRLLEYSAHSGIPVAIVGSKEDVLNKAVENLKNEIHGLNVVYAHHGYFKNYDEIYQGLNEAVPRLLLVALGSPKQEYFIYNAKKVLKPCLMIGVGGSLDVWSGSVKRAPIIFQKLGLEWLYRVVTQPERFKRIFPALPLFLLKVLKYRG